MKKLLMISTFLLFKIGCMAYSEKQAVALVNSFYEKLNIIADETYSILSVCDEPLTATGVNAKFDFYDMAYSRSIFIPNDFLWFYIINRQEEQLMIKIYPLRLIEMVQHLHKHRLPYTSPYKIDVISVSIMGENQDSADFCIVKLNKRVTFGRKTINYDEEITIHVPSNKIVKIENTATDPDMVVIDIDENEEEEQQAKARQLVEYAQENLPLLNNPSIQKTQKDDCLKQLKEIFLCTEEGDNFNAEAIIFDSATEDARTPLDGFIKSLPRGTPLNVLAIDTYRPYKFSKNIDGNYIVWANVFTYVFKPESEIGYEVIQDPDVMYYNTQKVPMRVLALPDGSKIKSIDYHLGNIAVRCY